MLSEFFMLILTFCMYNRLELQRRLCIFVQKLKRREKSGWKHLDLVCSCCSLCSFLFCFSFIKNLLRIFISPRLCGICGIHICILLPDRRN